MQRPAPSGLSGGCAPAPHRRPPLSTATRDLWRLHGATGPGSAAWNTVGERRSYEPTYGGPPTRGGCMKTQAALLLQSPGRWEVCEVEVDPPKDHEVLVRMVASGLCHSDVHYN